MLDTGIITGEPWIACEDDYLRDNLRIKPLVDVAIKLKRSVGSVERRAKLLGVKRLDTRLKWTPALDAVLLLELAASKAEGRLPSWVRAAAALGMTADAVKKRAYRLRE